MTCVCVLEGVARIGKHDDHMDEVTPGLRKIMFGDGRPAEIVPIEPGHEASLEQFVASTKDAFD